MKTVCYVGIAGLGTVSYGIYTVAKHFHSILSNVSVCSLVPVLEPFVGSLSVSSLVSKTLGGMFLSAFTVSIIAGGSAGNLSSDFPLVFRVAAFLRTPVLMFLVVPMSFARAVHTNWKIWYNHRFPNSAGSHEERVEKIKDQVKKWNESGRQGKLRTARAAWLSMSTKLSSNKEDARLVHVGDMSKILEIDTKKMTITCEPGVTMGMITHQLLPLGLALTVQVEMESISIGGVSMGFGMETNSHRAGFFQESVVSYEIVTADAIVKRVTAKSDPDLFYALPWSCGTLGFLTSVTVRIIRTKPFVHIKYIPTHSKEELCRKMTELSYADDAPGFLEATIYSKETAIIQVAEFVDVTTAEQRKMINPINAFYKPFYYKHVETFLDKNGGEEIVPLVDYYHRFTRSIFWELEDMIPFSNHPIYRCLWGWLGAPEVSLLKLFQGPVIRKASVYAHVVQESIMPISLLDEGIDKFDKWFGVYPLLVFPLRVYDRGDRSGFLNPQGKNLKKGTNWGIWCDLGAYGAPRAVKEGKNWDCKKEVRAMEHWTRDIGGWQAYYTDLFCTEKEFRQMFNHELLDKCREKLNAVDAFPTVYEKMRSEVVDLTDEVAAENKAKNLRRSTRTPSKVKR
jgi:delta24-sterol reductase